MNEVILSGLGILLALCGMTVLIFRRVSPIIVGPLAALLVTVMSGLPVLDSVTGVYVAGVGSFFVSYFMIFLLGNILGSLYQISGAAAKIGETVVRWFGAKNCMVACLISAALLSYGGINSFVIIFALSFVLRQFEDFPAVRYAFWGIRVAVVALVLSALVSMAKECPWNIVSYLLAAGAFVLVGLLGANSIVVLIACALVGLAASKLKIGGMKL